MMRVQLFAAALASAALLLAGPRTVAAEPATENAKILEELKDLKKAVNDRMDQLDRSIKETQNKAASLEDRVYRLQRDALTVDDLRALRSQVDQVQRDLEAVRSQVGSVRESLKPAPQAPEVSRRIPVPMGTFRITSNYSYVAEVLVNGQRYFVMPGDVLSIPVPEGPFTYQVIGNHRAPRNGMIVAGKLFPIGLHNQQ